MKSFKISLQLVSHWHRFTFLCQFWWKPVKEKRLKLCIIRNLTKKIQCCYAVSLFPYPTHKTDPVFKEINVKTPKRLSQYQHDRCHKTVNIYMHQKATVLDIMTNNKYKEAFGTIHIYLTTKYKKLNVKLAQIWRVWTHNGHVVVVATICTCCRCCYGMHINWDKSNEK